MIKIKEKTAQEWISIESITNDGIIKSKNDIYLKILEVKPINYNLKSDLEKEAILNSYKTFLKTCNFDIQILIQSSKEDLSQHISKIKENISKKENNFLKELSENYIEYISKINLKRRSSSKKYYLIIKKEKIKKRNEEDNYEYAKSDLKEKYLKIKECLLRCGNLTTEINEKDKVLEIYNSFFNTKDFLNKTLERRV